MDMPKIRVSKEHWGEVWKALVEVGAVSLISEEPIYIVSKKHLEALKEKNLPFEILDSKRKVEGGAGAQASKKV